MRHIFSYPLSWQGNQKSVILFGNVLGSEKFVHKSNFDTGALVPMPTRPPPASSIVSISRVPAAPSPFARNRI